MGADTVITCWAFLTADEYLYWLLLVIPGMSVRPPTVWVPMLSTDRTFSDSTIRKGYFEKELDDVSDEILTHLV